MHCQPDNEQILKCLNCLWQGKRVEIHYDTVETCMGNDKIEVCPNCGSFELHIKPNSI